MYEYTTIRMGQISIRGKEFRFAILFTLFCFFLYCPMMIHQAHANVEERNPGETVEKYSFNSFQSDGWTWFLWRLGNNATKEKYKYLYLYVMRCMYKTFMKNHRNSWAIISRCSEICKRTCGRPKSVVRNSHWELSAVMSKNDISALQEKKNLCISNYAN